MDSNHQARRRYWTHWGPFLRELGHRDRYLAGTSISTRIALLTAFAERVRRGDYGRGRRVKADSVRLAIRAIGKTCELVGLPNPTYREPNRYLLPLARQLEAFQRDDPVSQPQLAVPVTVPHHIYDVYSTSKSAKLRAIGDLALIAFFFLLRVGEYTFRHAKLRTRTQQFRVGDARFYSDGKIIPNRSPLPALLAADRARLKIDNQKNGARGQVVAHEAIPADPRCCVKALARRVHGIFQAGGTDDTILAAYPGDRPDELGFVTSPDMLRAVRWSVKDLDLAQQGIYPAMVGSHSLRAGGATTMFLDGKDRDTIRKYGRWSSDTFLMYIHEQIDAFSTGVAAGMAQIRSFVNLGG